MNIKHLQFKNIIIALLFALMSGSAWAYSFMVDGIYYNITDANNLTVEVTNNGSYGTYTTSVVIPATVTNTNDNQIYTVTAIGNNAFHGCTSLTSVNGTGTANVTIPTSVTSIGTNAFLNCTGLTDLTLPANLTYVGQSAFQGCSGLENIYFNATNCTVSSSSIFGNCTHDCTATIGDNVTSLPDYVFYQHSGLKTINWGTHTTLTIGEFSFSRCGLTAVVIPDCVTSIAHNAFSDCGNLTTLTIGANVISVGYYAFSGCSKLETVNYNAINCTSIPDNGSIYYNMWNGCNKLTTIVIGNEVTHLPAMLFYGTTITTVNFGSDPHLQVIYNRAFYNCDHLTSFTIPNTVTTIGYSAFGYDNALQSITIGSGVTTIGDQILYGCSGLETINWNVTNAENNLSLGSNCFTGIGNADQHACALTVGDNVIALPSSIFSGCSGITSLTLGSRLQTIGDYAFSGCSHIGAITIPNSVTYLGKESFKNCSAATSLSIGASVQDIKQGAFAYCSGLTSLTIPTTVTTIGNTESTAGAFQGCTGLTELIIPDNVTFVGRDAFNGCSNITTITIGDGVTYIGLSAFAGCTNLTELTIGKGVTTIIVNAFQNNGNLAAVYYNATSCSDLGTTDNLWTNCNHDCTVHIGNNVTKLPQSIFRNFSHLTTVDFGSTTQLTTIGSHAFENCTGLTTVVIPNNVTTIDSDAFEGCAGITSLNLGTGVQTIGAYAFKGCTGLTTLMIPASVTSIEGVGWTGTGAFDGCTGLTEIWFMGTTQPSINSYAFDGVSETIPLYYPKGYLSSYTYGRFANKIPFSRFDGGSGETGAQWGVAGNWAFGIPQYNEAALINATAIIPGAYTVNVDHIAFTGSNYMIIENAGQLHCNSITSAENSQVTIRNGGQLYCKSEVKANLEKYIAGWSSVSSNSGWYTIASPAAGISVYINTSGEFDMLAYRESDHTWRNIKDPSNDISTFDQAQGFLYANAAGQTVVFGGTMPASDATITKPLDYNTASSDNKLVGFNLVGNPFPYQITSGMVTMNDEALTTYYIAEGGSNLKIRNLASAPINPGCGFFVQAPVEGCELVFNPTSEPSKGETEFKPTFISIEAGNSEYTDMAYVQLGQGNTLRKMSINDNTPLVYVMHNNADYAAATVESFKGSMPVCFKAVETGSYTISVNTEGMEMDYLHLIDRFTGADIDLLLEPSYSFVATKGDNESRFILAFTANCFDENENEIFAFQNGNDLVVNGEGELQIFDMSGRLVAKRYVNGIETMYTSSLQTGVYILRLVGDTQRTQKIVVE